MASKRVHRADFGDAWPLTVDRAWLRHDDNTGALRIQVGWKVYALNGLAASHHGDRDITPIHAANPDIPPYADDDGEQVIVRKSLTPLVSAAQTLG